MAGVAAKNETVEGLTDRGSLVERAVSERADSHVEASESEKSEVTASLQNFCGSQVAVSGRDKPIGDLVVSLTLDPDQPLGDSPPRRWAQLLADTEALIAGGWAAQARALGWTALDLFGCDPDRPFARIDQQGLCWLLNGRKVIALTATAATIETPTGARLTYRRSPSRKDQMLP